MKKPRFIQFVACGGLLPVFVALLFALFPIDASAAPYSGDTFTYTQPNGESFKVRLWGDEFFAYQETEDGYLITRDPKTGEWCYARVIKNGTEIVSTGVRVGKAKPPGLKPKQRLKPEAAMEKSRPRREAMGKGTDGRLLPELHRKIFPEAHRKQQGGKKSPQPDTTESSNTDTGTRYAPGTEEPTDTGGEIQFGPPTSTSTGTRTGLVLLAYFPDRPEDVNRTVADIDAFCNAETYTADGNAVSVYKYFDIQSGGKLSYKNVVTAWFPAQYNRSYYTSEEDTFSTQGKNLLKEGLEALDAAGFDFSQCDADGDGVIDGVNMLYAGTRINSHGVGLWPQQGTANWTGFTAHGLQNSFQYQWTDMPATLPIGTFIHENGHMICDFPDLYPYNGNAARVWNFSVMSAYIENHPGNVDPYLKIKAGWASVTDLTSSSHQRCVTRVDNNHFYRYRRQDTPNEYFLWEARHNSGYEGPFGGASNSVNLSYGLVAYHVKESGSNTGSTIFTGANPVSYTTPFELLVLEANPSTSSIPWYTDPTPGTNDAFHAGDKSELSDTTLPALKFWATDGRTVTSGAHVHSVSSISPVMSFTVGTGALTNPAEMAVTIGSLSSVIEAGFDADDHNFVLFNTGTGTFTYTVSDDQPWLEVLPASGSVTDGETDELTVSYSTTGLLEGTHNATITITGSGSVNSSITIPVSVTVTGSAWAPLITTQPANVHLTGNANHTLTVEATGSPVPIYEWYKNNTLIPSAVSSSLDLVNVTAADAGSYHVVITNSQGQVTSAPAVVTVNDHPAITLVTPGVAEVNLPSNTGLILECGASDDGYGGSSLSYAWSVVSAPGGGSVTWDNQNALATAATFSIDGSYILRLAVSDGVNTETQDFSVVAGALPGGSVSTNSLIAHYKFNESPGATEAVDAAGADQNATLQGGATFTGFSLDLDGVDDWVNVPQAADINTSGPYPARTVALWFKADAINGLQLLFEEGGISHGANIFLYRDTIQNEDRLYCQAWGSSWANNIYAPGITAGNWYHVAMVLDSTQAVSADRLKLYVNGEFIGSRSAQALQSHNNGTGIGGKNGDTKYPTGVTSANGDFFAGEIDDFRLYNRGLSANEVDLLFRRTDNLAPLVDAGPSTVTFVNSAVGLDGTVTDDDEPLGPGTVVTQWTLASGPGNTTLGDPATVDTSFSADALGTYTLRLSADDGLVRTFDETACDVISASGPGILRFVSASYNATEGGGSVELAVERPAGAVSGAVSVSYAVSGGTAVNGEDYTLSPGTLSWADGESGVKTIAVTILEDAVTEGDEVFTVALNNATGGASIASPSSTSVIIADNELPDTVLFADNFNTTSTSFNADLATRQSGTLATSTYSGSGGTISGNRLSGGSGSDFANDLDFETSLKDSGITGFTMSFDLANTGSNWVATFLSTHSDSSDDRGSSRFGMHLWQTGNITAYGDSGTGQATTGVSKATLDTLLGYSFDVTASNTFSFVATPTSTTAGTYDLFVNGVEVLSDVAYLLGNGGSNGQINWENRNTTGSVGLFDNLEISVSHPPVVGGNQLPVWSGSPVAGTDATQNSAYSGSLAGHASDANNDPLTFAKVSGPGWLSVAPDGTLSGTPGNGDVGANVFTVSVTDSVAAPVEASLEITVINVNNAPVFTADPIAGANATQDSAYSATLAGTATDADAGDTLTFAKVSGPGWLSVATDGTLSGTPGNGDVGANVFTVSVTDSVAAPVEASLEITVINVNDAPVFTADPIATANATQDSAYSATLAGTATDIDAGDTLTFAKVSGPAWLSVATNGTLSGTPQGSDVGANVFTVSVSDNNGGSDTAVLNITVVIQPFLTVVIADGSVPENGGVTTATITRGGSSGELLVSLASSDTGEATVPSTATIPDGQNSTQVSVTAVNDGIIDGNQSATITATATGHLTGENSVIITDAGITPVTVIADFSDGVKPVVWSGGILSSSNPEAGANSGFTYIHDISALGIGDATQLRISVATEGSQIVNAGGHGISLKGGVNDGWWEGSEGALTFTAVLHNASTVDVTGNYNIDLTGASLRWRDNTGGTPVLTVNTETLNYNGGGLAVNQGLDLATGQTTETTITAGRTGNDICQFQQLRFTIQPTFANTPPVWMANPLTRPDATTGTAYSATLSGATTDADGHALVHTKVSGPAWLTIAADGTMSGTPASGDAGLNEFIVSISDGIAASVEATVQISVLTHYEVWGESTFTLEFVDRDLGSDPDGDGLTNLLEFAFGTDPTSASSSIAIDGNGQVTQHGGRPTLYLASITETSVDFRAIFSRRKDFEALGLSYTVEFGTLQAGSTWVASAQSPILMDGSDDEIDVVYLSYPPYISTPNGFEKPRFFRIGVGLEN